MRGLLVVAVTQGAAERDAGEAAVVTVAGGLLAPLTRRYAVRDLALELSLPLVLAVPAGRDAINLARLTLEAARGAALAVAAIVLTHWPDAPDRVLLDERRLLGELTGVEVVALPTTGDRDEATGGWPVAEWLDAAPTTGNANALIAGKAVLEPYKVLSGRLSLPSAWPSLSGVICGAQPTAARVVSMSWAAATRPRRPPAPPIAPRRGRRARCG